jgi:MtfA peptidase
MVLSYFIFYTCIGLVMLLFTEGNKSAKIFAQKYFRPKNKDKPFGNVHYHQILSRHFPYYINLNHEGKMKFLARLTEFINSKTFVGMQDLKVTSKMEVLISASAIQLTYGLKKYLLEYFTVIKVYPHFFYSNFLNAELKGGASESGILMLSWEDFLLGYKHLNNFNLGLHEMAHVLKINVLKGNDFDDKFSFYMDEWEKIGSSEFNRLRESQQSFLRAYAGTNHQEFFAVCVEHFFENPDTFKEELPDLYNHLCFLLNQDPRNSENNYRLNQNFKALVNKNSSRIPIPKRIKEHYKYHTWHWAYTIMLSGIFAGIMSTFILYTVTLISVMHILLFSAIGGLLAFIVQYRFLVIKNQVFKPADFSLYALFGVMPLVAGLFMSLNFLIRVSYQQESHIISSYTYHAGNLVVNLENEAYSNYTSFRTIKNKDIASVDVNRKLNLYFAKGVFGYSFLIKKGISD